MRSSDFRVYTGIELVNRPMEEDPYLIEGILWEGDCMFLLGKEKSGKSILALQLVCALVSGTPFLSKYEVVEPMEVLYVQTEGKVHETAERIKNMTCEQGVSWSPARFNLLYYHSLALDTDPGYNQFRQLIGHLNPRVIILDPLYMSMQGDLSDNTTARRMVRNLRRLAEEFNSSLVVVHHQHRPYRNKQGEQVIDGGDDSIFGSFVWKAFADHVMSLYVRKDKVRLLTCHTQRSARVIENVEMQLIAPYPLLYSIIGEDQKPYVREVLEHILKTVDPRKGVTAKELEVSMTLSKSAIKKSLMILHKESHIRILNVGHRPCLYAPILTPKTESDDGGSRESS